MKKIRNPFLDFTPEKLKAFNKAVVDWREISKSLTSSLDDKTKAVMKKAIDWSINWTSKKVYSIVGGSTPEEKRAFIEVAWESWNKK